MKHLTTRKRILAVSIQAAFINLGIASLVYAETQATTVTEDTLPTIVVQADNEKATKPVKGFIAKTSITANKTDTPLIETPQSISVITQDQIAQLGAKSIQDALGYSAGVIANPYGTDPRTDWGFIRGVNFAQFIDGLQNIVAPIRKPRIEPYTLERIEVLRGPSSMLYGQSTVGGLINMVSKRPQAQAGGNVELQYGTNDRKQVAVDVTGPVAGNSEWLYRLVALGRDSETDIDYNDDNRIVVAPSITWQPSEKTHLTILTRYQEDKSAGSAVAFWPALGTAKDFPGYGKIPRNRFIGEPGADHLETKEYSVGWEFEHAFNDTFTVRQNARYNKTDMSLLSYFALFSSIPGLTDINPGYVNGLPAPTIARFNYAEESEQKTFTVDNQLQIKLDTSNIKNTILFGVDYSQNDSDRSFAQTPFDPAQVTFFNPFNPVYGNRGAKLSPVAQPSTTNKQLGFYLQDQSKFGEHVVLTLGLRHDKVDSEVEGAKTISDKATTAKAGLVYLFSNGIAPYISYNESFIPVAGVDANNNPFKAKEGKQYEVGVKYQPADGHANITASVYKIEESNQVVSSPTNPTQSVQAGDADIKGFELEAKLKVTPAFNVLANYAYTNAKIDAIVGYDYATGQNIAGDRVASLAKNTAGLWGSYEFSILGVPGFSVGSGLRYIGSTSNENESLTLPSVTLWDAALGYQDGPWAFRVNAANLTDKEYVTGCLTRGDCYYGTERNVVLTAKYNW